MTGYLSERDNAENYKCPWTCTNWSLSINGVNFASSNDLDMGRPSNQALISSVNLYFYTH